MKRALAVACLVALVGVANADSKNDPTGTWTYTTEFNGQSIEVTIKMKSEGDKVTGTVTVAGMEAKIEDGKIKDGLITFKTVRDVNGNEITIKYEGKVNGDTFKGKRELTRGGETNTKEIEAKRQKE